MICWLLLLGCLGCVRLPLFQSLMGAGLRSCTAGLFMSCLVSSWGYSRDDDPCSAVFLLVGPRDAVWMKVGFRLHRRMAGAFALWIGWLGVYLGVHGEGRVMHAFLRVCIQGRARHFSCGCSRSLLLHTARWLHGSCRRPSRSVGHSFHVPICAAVRSLDGRLDAGT
ncbi:hypothetical protein D5086_027220 [Populus alba]|uniref:Uncharacterized protein n=1 Tax=Populus alba TaxID=43335 RepID=A0ACC4B4L6_POPAL